MGERSIGRTSPCCVSLCIYCESRMKELWRMLRGSVAPMPSVSVASRRLSGEQGRTVRAEPGSARRVCIAHLFRIETSL
jgi:hypothetical protein